MVAFTIESPSGDQNKLQQKLGLARGIYLQIRDFASYQMDPRYEKFDTPVIHDPYSCRVFMKDLCATEDPKNIENKIHKWDELDKMLWLLANPDEYSDEWLNAREREQAIEESRGL